MKEPANMSKLAHIVSVQPRVPAQRLDHLVQQLVPVLLRRLSVRHHLSSTGNLARLRPQRLSRSNTKSKRNALSKYNLLHRSSAHPASTAPPFTLKISPEINPAKGVQRKSTGAAISSTSAGRP